ncbi:MAG: FecR domain-containing protein [Pseudomonadota bacterium]
MSASRRLLERFGLETALEAREAEALLSALERRGVLAGDVTRALRAAPGPRGQPSLLAPRARRPWGAALALVTLALGLSTLHLEPSPGALLLDEVLHSPERPAERAPTPALSLGYQGSGRLTGPEGAPSLAWEAGTVHIAVAPGSGTHLVVQTREAVITDLGTTFTVTRVGPGTTVEVADGEVEVRCAAGGQARLLAGQSHHCGPASEAGWLALAHRVHESGAEPARALQVIAAGEAQADPGGVVAYELLALRAQVLAEAGRERAALEAVRAALELPQRHRRSELLALGEALAMALGDEAAAAELRTIGGSD